MTPDETQIQILANWPMSHAKRVTRDNWQAAFSFAVLCIIMFFYIELALTDFNKNKVFHSVYMWLQLSQVKKKIHRRKREKTSIYLLR